MARHGEHKEETVGMGRLLWANQMAAFTQCFLQHTMTVLGEVHPWLRVRLGGGLYTDTTLCVGGYSH